MEREFNSRRGAVAGNFHGGRSMFDTANLMNGRQDQSLHESAAVSTTWHWLMDQPAGFMPNKCGWDPHNRRMMTSQHLQTLSTCPFEPRKLPKGMNMQWTTANRPANRGLQLWTSNRSSQATHCRNPAVLNEDTFQRNNLNWTQEGKHRRIHKLVPMVQVLFLWFFLKREVLGPLVITSPRSRGTFSNVRLCSGHLVKSFQFASTWPRGASW